VTQTLFSYMKTVQQMISDTRQELIAPFTLINYINRARREVAMRSQCLRILPPISGGVETITVTAPGSGYTNPTVTVTAPTRPTAGPYTRLEPRPPPQPRWKTA